MPNIAPRFYRSHVYKAAANSARVSVELFLDYNCPFSGKLFTKVSKELIPLLEMQNKADKFDFTFINVVQPWHHLNSGAEHEVALAVAKLYPDKFWEFSQVLFDNLDKFVDTELYDVSRREVYDRLIKLAVKSLDGVDPDALWELVQITPSADGKPANSGNQVATDLKYFTRYARTVGVHVTPTVFVNGIANPSIESSTSVTDLAKILEKEI